MRTNFRAFYTTLPVLIAVSLGTGSAADDTKWFFGLRTMIRRCATWNKTEYEEFLETFRNCVQKRVLTSLDNLLAEDVIPVVSGMNLIRYQEDRRHLTKDARSRNQVNDTTENGSLAEIAWKRLARVLRTHVIKFDLDCLTNNLNATRKSQVGTGRDMEGQLLGRRRRQRKRQLMMPLMMMGLLLMGSIFIPMGFQFLAVLGGKALILAKMALILSSIQGLKKIATNGVNYGLYHAPVVESWHDRSSEEAPTHFDLPYPAPPQYFP